MDVRSMQQHLLATVTEELGVRGWALDARVRAAFLATPRHLFVERYRTRTDPTRHEVTPANLQEHLPALYANEALGIHGEPGDEQTATISQPAMVLFMLDVLRLAPGLRVFEVGAGSGWNAALMGHMVGPTGYVQSLELIPELAARARRCIADVGLAHVDVRLGDAAMASSDRDSFDRVVLTAGAHDIPAAIHDRLTDGGLLLMVLSCPGGGETMVLLRRDGDELTSMEAHPCEFVPMLGAGRRREHEPQRLDALASWPGLRERVVARRPFPCGGGTEADFPARTFALRSFLAAVEPRLRAFVLADGSPAFGLIEDDGESLVVVRHGDRTCYGTSAADDRLQSWMTGWIERGMPAMASMPLRAVRSAIDPRTGPGEIAMRRDDTTFVWRLD